MTPRQIRTYDSLEKQLTSIQTQYVSSSVYTLQVTQNEGLINQPQNMEYLSLQTFHANSRTTKSSPCNTNIATPSPAFELPAAHRSTVSLGIDICVIHFFDYCKY